MDFKELKTREDCVELAKEIIGKLNFIDSCLDEAINRCQENKQEN